MKRILFIREGRILLEEETLDQKVLSLKIGVGTQILKIHNIAWNHHCHRWELSQELKLAYLAGQTIDLELYYVTRKLPRVVAEANLNPALLNNHSQEEFKIAFLNDGMIRGWLYCLIANEDHQNSQPTTKFLYIHKINLIFLEDYEDQIKLAIIQNQKRVYEKVFTPMSQNKNLFPNLKSPIRYSDLIRICIEDSKREFKVVQVLVDHIERGKTAQYEAWIRNKYNNKAGELKLQYFLQNLFLENERKVLSRKPIYPNTLSRMSTYITQTTSKPSDTPLRTNFQIEEVSEPENQALTSKDPSTCVGTRQANDRPSLLNRTLFQLSNKVNAPQKEEESLKKWKTNNNLAKVSRKVRNNFYLQYPLQ